MGGERASGSFDAVDEILQARSAGPEAYLVGLDRTGIEEAPLPPPLADEAWSWRVSDFWQSWMTTPLDAIAEGDLEVTVSTFLMAIQHGFASCAVRSIDDRPLLLNFSNLLDAHSVMVVLAQPADAGAMSQQAASNATDEPAPLLLVQTCTVHGLIESIDDATRQVLGWGNEVIGRSRLEFQDDQSNVDSSRSWVNVLAHPDRSFRNRIRLRTAWGEYRWFDATSHNELATKGVVVIEHFDITEHMTGALSQDPMYPLADYLSGLVNDGVLCIDDTGTVLAWNERFLRLTGMEVDQHTRRLLPAPQVIGEPFARVVRSSLSDREPRVHEAFVSHAQYRLRFQATLVPLTLDRRCCAVLATENLFSADRGGLPKGLAPATLEKVVMALAGSAGSQSVPALAERTGLSAVSIRRYVGFLVQSGEVTVHRAYGQRGRPSQTYSLTDPA